MNDAIPTASWGRRILALLVDWIASTLVAIVVVGGAEDYFEPGSPGTFVTLGVYVLESVVFTWLLGGSFGKIATRLRVVPADGVLRPINPLRLLLRQVLVALVIPPLVFRPDGRGLHDVVAGTATVTIDTFRALVAATPQGRVGR
ncbi:RDD family protein [Nocardioides plantarum]|uniref:RDD family protein n=1 Tax=Nocardioides plantarum TaxID=29299 RepID=A0ABV5KCU1_9ACTN|nr:RDD family protein [Nocardioides plantarum]